jgi:HAD superfamily hydrolase (TIGR01450 family)
MATEITALSDIAGHYDIVLCDVWGVLHNGVDAFDAASGALRAARQAGLTVVLITNSPRPSPGVIAQLRTIGVPDEAYDAIVTSGDVTRTLISAGPDKVFLLGPDRDLPLLEGLKVERVDEAKAGAIVCTGFFDDETETPEDYRAMLTRFAARQVPMICANPDLIVERGDRMIPCAGAMAALYREMGGKTFIAGKPHSPIYEEALTLAKAKRGSVTKSRVLAIGDGMPTDVRGAIDFGLDLLYVSAGIHGHDYMSHGKTDRAALDRFLAREGADPKWWIPRLA